jgi:hypothetical protein
MRGVMTPIRTVFGCSLALLVLALSACTGSSETPTPVLLVVGFQREADDSLTNHIGLIRDSLDQSSTRFDFLTASVRDLPQPPRAYDLTNREDARNTVVVLSRAQDPDLETDVFESYLSFFSLSRIDADNPVRFSRTRDDFNFHSEALEIVPNNFPNPDAPVFCPSKVQVTQDGTYAAVLNVPSLCGAGAAQNFIDVFDLRVNGRLLQRLPNVASGGLYMSQGSGADILYYASDTPNSLTLSAATMPRPSQTFEEDDRLSIRTNVASVDRAVRQGQFVDMGLSGTAGSDKLALLFGQAFAYVSGYTAEGGQAEGPVETDDNDNARLIRDDKRRTSATLVLSTPRGGRFSYFPLSFSTGDDNDPLSGEVQDNVTAVDAVINADVGLVYFVSTGRVSLFDLSSYVTGDDLSTTPFEEGLEALTLPNFVTWVQAAPPQPTE